MLTKTEQLKVADTDHCKESHKTVTDMSEAPDSREERDSSAMDDGCNAEDFGPRTMADKGGDKQPLSNRHSNEFSRPKMDDECPQSSKGRSSLMLDEHLSRDTMELSHSKKELEVLEAITNLLLNNREDSTTVHWVEWCKTAVDDLEGPQLDNGLPCQPYTIETANDVLYSCEERDSLLMDEECDDEHFSLSTMRSVKGRGCVQSVLSTHSNEIVRPEFSGRAETEYEIFARGKEEQRCRTSTTDSGKDSGRGSMYSLDSI
ncbi:uncharacterized protein LOC108940008 [Scleropages formosus]|uniref:uncharacterized protein LOC108940008 n=1 Tax=Scleropages formosus TaxID=113540 RepID=UPI000878F042|nr:uncharacterized protein LOC108940008 [Scleropages formosus]